MRSCTARTPHSQRVQANASPTSRAHCDGAQIHYERHCPEQTMLQRLVQQHAQSFFAQTEEATGASLPQFVKDEFDAYLECGILAHGFLRLRCADCGHDKLVAFSCKRRGFCPSCGARRMSQTAAHLVEHVIPRVPVRQWVLSLPIPLRLLLAAQFECQQGLKEIERLTGFGHHFVGNAIDLPQTKLRLQRPNPRQPVGIRVFRTTDGPPGRIDRDMGNKGVQRPMGGGMFEKAESRTLKPRPSESFRVDFVV